MALLARAPRQALSPESRCEGASPELYQLLIGQRGWSAERYVHFLADTWNRLLIAG